VDYLFLLEPGLYILAFLGVVAGAILTEAGQPLRLWWMRRRGWLDAEQSSPVRSYALLLASPRRATRMYAAKNLGNLGDKTAVPVLLRAAERHHRDGEFLEEVVRTLARLQDTRALPLMRRLSSGRHVSLVRAAREAGRTLEQQAVLLRSAVAPAAGAGTLLRPAGAGDGRQDEQLLRASSGTTGASGE
jgi:HEAT repeat protein